MAYWAGTVQLAQAGESMHGTQLLCRGKNIRLANLLPYEPQAAVARAGAMFIEVADIRSFKVGDKVAIGAGTNQQETKTIEIIVSNARRALRDGE
jgi:sRNA-binding protein